MKQYFRKFMREDDGAELVEYAIVIGIVAVVAVAVFAVVSVVYAQINNAGEQISGLDINNAVTGNGGNNGNNSTGNNGITNGGVGDTTD